MGSSITAPLNYLLLSQQTGDRLVAFPLLHGDCFKSLFEKWKCRQWIECFKNSIKANVALKLIFSIGMWEYSGDAVVSQAPSPLVFKIREVCPLLDISWLSGMEHTAVYWGIYANQKNIQVIKQQHDWFDLFIKGFTQTSHTTLTFSIYLR